MMHTEIFYLLGYLVLPSFLLKGALSRTTAVGTRAPTKVGDVIKWFLFKKKRCRFSLLLLSCLVSYWEDFLGFLFFPIAIREFSSRNQKNDNIVNLWDLDHRIIIPLKKKEFPWFAAHEISRLRGKKKKQPSMPLRECLHEEKSTWSTRNSTLWHWDHGRSDYQETG